ncbi:MAG: hypothetical protein NC180_05255 [Muribaculaceae bacterium]|nr:hypothetical protein [Roseburia sp.]MCM1430273.1 hypothetical protein [Muribaculaceae bacterium]MCM1492618.1 hypothetical protein [Muribaculaceae bacterium]
MVIRLNNKWVPLILGIAILVVYVPGVWLLGAVGGMETDSLKGITKMVLVLAGVLILLGVINPVRYIITTETQIQYYVNKKLIWSVNWSQIKEVRCPEGYGYSRYSNGLQIVTFMEKYRCEYNKKLLNEMSRHCNVAPAQNEIRKNHIAVWITVFICILMVAATIIFIFII